MKIFELFIGYMGKMVGAEAGAGAGAGNEILTSWSRSRTKIDRILNTAPDNKNV
jgi:hypothetical protein